MNSGDLAPMLVMITAIVTTGGVILLRPLSKRLGDLLEVMTRERRGVGARPDAERMEELLSRLDSRLSLLEERQSFTEALLDAQERRGRVAAGAEARAIPPAPRSNA